VSRANGDGGEGLNTINEDGSEQLSNGWEKGREREREKEREKERVEREADEKRRLDEADAQRIREITSKAVSAILVGMLKWFRVSRKF